MSKIVGIALLMLGASVVAIGGTVPEISAGSAGSAITLLSGVLLVMRSRRKK